MSPEDYSRSGNSEYDALPASVRSIYTLKEWLWLSDGEKAGLTDRVTTPEWEE